MRKIDEQTFKTNMTTLALDGSEDYLASQKLTNLVGEEMLLFRKKLLVSKPAATLREVRSQMSKPEGVKRNPPENPITRCPTKGELYDGDREDLNQYEATWCSDDEFVIPRIPDIPDLDLDAPDDSTTPKTRRQQKMI